MLSSLLLASVLIAAQPPMACAGATATATAIAPAAQPPQPEPREPIEPPVLEEPPTPEEPPMPEDPGIPTPDPTEPCCFTHARYAGVCVVRPAEDETCGTILAYLNDARAVGKTYCNNTDVRGGWEWVSCEAR